MPDSTAFMIETPAGVVDFPLPSRAVGKRQSGWSALPTCMVRNLVSRTCTVVTVAVFTVMTVAVMILGRSFGNVSFLKFFNFPGREPVGLAAMSLFSSFQEGVVSVIEFFFLDDAVIGRLHSRIMDSSGGGKQESPLRDSRTAIGLTELFKAVSETSDAGVTDGDIEQQLSELLHRLEVSGEPFWFDDFDRAITHAREQESPVFISSKVRFDAPQFRDLALGWDLVIQAGFLILSNPSSNDYDSSDSYFTAIKYSMVCDVSKMRPSGQQSGFFSQLGIQIRAHDGIDIPLNVFGILKPVGTVFDISPLALSL